MKDNTYIPVDITNLNKLGFEVDILSKTYDNIYFSTEILNKFCLNPIYKFISRTVELSTDTNMFSEQNVNEVELRFHVTKRNFYHFVDFFKFLKTLVPHTIFYNWSCGLHVNISFNKKYNKDFLVFLNHNPQYKIDFLLSYLNYIKPRIHECEFYRIHRRLYKLYVDFDSYSIVSNIHESPLQVRGRYLEFRLLPTTFDTNVLLYTVNFILQYFNQWLTNTYSSK